MSDQSAEPSEELLLPAEPVIELKKKNRRSLIASILVVLAIISSAVLAITNFWPADDEFSQIQSECSRPGTSLLVVDDGKTLLLDSRGSDINVPNDISALTCVLAKVNAPMAVVSQIEGTRALDGRQQASWDHYAASWTYHPDSGCDMILQKN